MFSELRPACTFFYRGLILRVLQKYSFFLLNMQAAFVKVNLYFRNTHVMTKKS